MFERTFQCKKSTGLLRAHLAQGIYITQGFKINEYDKKKLFLLKLSICFFNLMSYSNCVLCCLFSWFSYNQCLQNSYESFRVLLKPVNQEPHNTQHKWLTCDLKQTCLIHFWMFFFKFKQQSAGHIMHTFFFQKL